MGLSVNRADLENASNVARSGLQNVGLSSAAVSSQITSFINDSKQVLRGSGFDYVRGRLLMYQTALHKLINICVNLANNIEIANNKMINETKGLDLDTKNISELESRVSQIESLISWYSEYIVVDNTVPDDERVYMMRNQEMKNYYEGVLKIIKEQLDMLKRLESISNEAASILDSVGSDIDSYSSNVSNIQIANI